VIDMKKAKLLLSKKAYEEAKKIDQNIDEKIKRGEIIIKS